MGCLLLIIQPGARGFETGDELDAANVQRREYQSGRALAVTHLQHPARYLRIGGIEMGAVHAGNELGYQLRFAAGLRTGLDTRDRRIVAPFAALIGRGRVVAIAQSRPAVDTDDIEFVLDHIAIG